MTSLREKRLLSSELYKLDWIKILDDAIEARPESWSDDPVNEWRNAGDTLHYALRKALKEKNILE